MWGGIRRDADARALVLASESEEWNYERLEVRAQLKLDIMSLKVFKKCVVCCLFFSTKLKICPSNLC